MNKKQYAFITLAVLLTSLFISGCSVVERISKEYSKDKEEGYLNSKNVTQFTYDEKEYTILEDTVKREDVGGWVGYIRKLVVLDADGTILLQEDTGTTTLKTMADISDTQPNAAYMISFYNVYDCKADAEHGLIVDVNGKFHKAILSDSITDSDDIFHYDRQQPMTSAEHFSVNPDNCTQLMSGDKVYQITDEIVSDEQVGEYLDIIAESIVFDKETKLQIPQDELWDIDWDGDESSAQKRENWSYGDVHAIQNTDVSDAVAVEINSEYRIATCR